MSSSLLLPPGVARRRGHPGASPWRRARASWAGLRDHPPAALLGPSSPSRRPQQGSYPSYTSDRAKCGTKRILLTDSLGVPLGLAVAGANTNDFKLVQQTFDSVPVPRPPPVDGRRQHLCVDAGYDYEPVRRWADKFGFTLHVRRIRQERKQRTRKKPRRWVVERSHSSLHRFRRLLVRWEKREDTYLAMLHLAVGIITWFHSLLPK